jgi:hypothetical protein
MRAGPHTPLHFLAIPWKLACVAKWAQICGAADGPHPLTAKCLALLKKKGESSRLPTSLEPCRKSSPSRNPSAAAVRLL